MAVLPDVLAPGIVNETVTTLDVHNTLLQDFFNMRMDGGSRKLVHGRHFSWDVFDETREVATARVPGTPPARKPPQPVGNVVGTFPRIHEEIPLAYEEIHNLRQIGGPSNQIDLAGENYIIEQERILAQRFTNHREFQLMALSRGKYFYTQSGDDLNVSLTSGAVQVDFQVPSNHNAILTLIGGLGLTGSWATDTTDIPLHLETINAQVEQDTGQRIAHGWCNAKTMADILRSTVLQGRAGTANPILMRRDVGADNAFTIRLRGLEWMEWHVTDSGLNLNGTFTKLFADNEVLLCPNPNPSWVQSYAGSEVVVEWIGRTPTERFDAYFYAEPVSKPAGYNLIGIMNVIPALKRPKNIWFINDTLT